MLVIVRQMQRVAYNYRLSNAATTPFISLYRKHGTDSYSFNKNRRVFALEIPPTCRPLLKIVVALLRPFWMTTMKRTLIFTQIHIPCKSLNTMREW